MVTSLQRTSGLSEAQCHPHCGLRFRSYDLVATTESTAIVSAFPLIIDTGSVYQPATLVGGRVNFPSTLCARINQTGTPAIGTCKLLVRGLDQFGEAIEEETPTIVTVAKVNNWIYLAKVFSVVYSVQYQDNGMSPVALSLGPRFDWVRTVDATNEHHAGDNIGIGIPTELGFTPYPQLRLDTADRNHLMPERVTAEGILTFGGAQPAIGETVIIGSITYTFKTVITSPFDVFRGASAADCAENLRRAINVEGVAGVNYGTGTVAHPTVIGIFVSALVLGVRARHGGNQGNLIGTTETMADVLNIWGGATLGLGRGDTGEIIGVVLRDVANLVGSNTRTVGRNDFALGQSAEGWIGSIEKLGFQASIGSYLTSDQAWITVNVFSRHLGW